MIWAAIVALLYALFEWHIITPAGGWRGWLLSVSDWIDEGCDEATFGGYTNDPPAAPPEALRLGAHRLAHPGHWHDISGPDGVYPGFTIQRTIGVQTLAQLKSFTGSSA